MARKVLSESDMVIFVPASNQIIIPDKWVRPERLMLIVNTTRNITLYNFSDPTKGYTSVTSTASAALPNPIGAPVYYPVNHDGAGNNDTRNIYGTIITLAYNCSAMDVEDDIMIMVDEFAETVQFDDTMLDGAQRLRVGTPQSLIDTDFEYSVQPSKWEAVFLSQKYPSFFAKPNGGNAIQVVSIISDGASPRSNITVTTLQPHGGVVGSIASIQETQAQRAEGTYTILTVPSATTFTYKGKGTVNSGDISWGSLSVVYLGDVYEHAHIPGGAYPGLGAIPGATNTMNAWVATSDNAAPLSNITVTFTNVHGLFPGTPISVQNTGVIDGDYYVTSVPNARTIVFTAYSNITSISIPSTARIIAKSDGYVIHRPWTAGVALTAYNPVPGLQTIRQTRRYFRYQAGKAIQFSTGAKLTPVFTIDSMTIPAGTAGTTQACTIATIEDHGLQVGAVVLVEGADTSQAYNPYNGYFTVTSIIDSNTFTTNVPLAQSVQTADLLTTGLNIYVHAAKWYGASAKAGLYDDQNGFYFEYDGQELYACRKHSEKLIQGRVNATFGSNIITGIGTQFRRQLLVNQEIVLRGSTYKIISISSDTSVNVSPAYRGPSVTGIRGAIVQVERYGNDQWNWDNADGTGPTGYIVDTTKMQMLYIDYTWYGAGTIRWGLRTHSGKIAWLHRVSNNNNNAVAYQRSGNLPARYEVSTEPSYNYNTRLIAGGTAVRGSVLGPNDTTMWVENVHDWPAAGILWMKDDVNTELLTYSNISAYNVAMNAYQLTIQRRTTSTLWFPTGFQTLAGGAVPVTFTPDSTISGSGGSAQVGIQQILMQCSPIVQHWGSSVIEDGGYNADLLPIFTGGMTKYSTVEAGVARPLILLRLAPSVDNAVAKNFGQRDVINRMAMNMKAIGIQTNGAFRIDVILNPAYVYYSNYSAATLAATRTNITATNGSNIITIKDTGTANTSGMTGITNGMAVTGTSIPAGTIINQVNGNQIVMSAAVSGTAPTTITLTPQSGYVGIPNDWQRDPIGNSSLAQVIYLDNSGPGQGTVQPASGYLQGGDSIFSFFTENGGGASNYNSSVYDLSGIKDMGNSQQSGNGNVATPGFPAGPDLLAIVATNIGTASSQISSRISWTEAQA